MKKCIALFLCLCLVVLIPTPANACAQSNEGNVIYYQETDLGNGLTVIDEVTELPQARTTYGKTANRTATFKDGDTVIAVIVFQATFHYDGTTVSVASKSVIQTDTYDGWSYKQTSFTSSGGTVTLNARLTKLLIFNNAFTMTLSCDKNGNISYT